MTKEIKIIGFSGRKQSGKDTACAGLMVRFGFEKIVVVRFADYLKLIFKDCFGIDKFGTEKEKNKIMPNGGTVRTALQFLGTDAMRTIDSDCFIRPWKRNIELIKQNRRTTEFIIVPDVRFPNEVRAIQNENGIVIRLTKGNIFDSHKSESALNDDTENMFDFKIDNRFLGILHQWNEVNLCVEGHFNLNG